ncbi:MAG: Type I Iterative PKS [Bogoriella megaspora]|nr:MAG: Type I Iterative PKS [Bogoriella megaspora]
MATTPSVLAFGAQTTWPTVNQATFVRNSLLRSLFLRPLVHATHELHLFWQDLVSHNALLQRAPGPAAIRTLQRWLTEEGVLVHAPEKGDGMASSAPNVLSTPLTVLIHISLYTQYLHDHAAEGLTHENLLRNLKYGGAQGLCAGILSAFVCASSKDEVALGDNAATALRLALALGAQVDVDGLMGGDGMKHSCHVLRWKSDSEKQSCDEVLESYRQVAYESVRYDHNSITVTVQKSSEAAMLKELASKKILTRQIELEGRFHSKVHAAAAEKLNSFIQTNPSIRLPSSQSMIIPVRANGDGDPIDEINLSSAAIRSILLEPANWHSVITKSVAQVPEGQAKRILIVGITESVPPSIAHQSRISVIKSDGTSREQSRLDYYSNGIPANAVAVIGMAAKYAGADTVHDFWDVIKEGRIMVEPLPGSRWAQKGLRRSPDNAPWWGNFVHDMDCFDHKFFRKLPREAAAMDPQQRMLLEAAYQTVESSGYFGSPTLPEDIGCYIGVATQDYHDNIASQSTSAFSSIGELRAFLSGRLSYHFGWTGPSMSFDTACSASMVAIDAACKAIQYGQVSAALAGGVNAMSSPYLWENLRAANFLSPTGGTKPFDADADGYCRGEGVGLVFLKKLSLAITDGDPILSVIAGTAVNQCKNDTYITVPHGPSQSALYSTLIKQTKLDKEAISFVEAHGTGTQVGDPIEIESISKVLVGNHRNNAINLGSVKGSIGHCEAASGVASLIKSVLMVQHGTIPPLAGHRSLNPKISLPNEFKIPKSSSSWKASFRAALVNNYGAAGSNAAAIVCGPPTQILPNTTHKLNKVPFMVSAKSRGSLEMNCKRLRSYAADLASSGTTRKMMADLAFNIADKKEHFVEQTFVTTASSLSEMAAFLEDASANCLTAALPVVLVFGGQTRSQLGLSRELYDKAPRFRHHLDVVNDAVRLKGLPSLFPAVFQAQPVENIVSLHCIFFAVQYASAKTWMDCGLNVDAVIGHSFGQLTALCISGVLTLHDVIKLVSGRARLMQERWGPERGSMISLQADGETVNTVQQTLKLSGHHLEVACYNGPNSHVLVGDEASINQTQIILDSGLLGKIRYRRLQVTHGFHSRFTEDLLPGLEDLAKDLTFLEPVIAIEPCTFDASNIVGTPKAIADHTRKPVYFSAAICRLAQRLGDCTWIEAGGDSGVVGMVKAALSRDAAANNSFHGVKLTGEGSLDNLAETTVDLWKAGQRLRFWAFDRSQRKAFAPLLLPPYQFERTRHWLEWKEPETATLARVKTTEENTSHELVTMTKRDGQSVYFNVDPRSEEFRKLLSGHAVLDSPLCPADLYVEIVRRASNLLEQSDSSFSVFSVENMAMTAPLGIDSNRKITLTMTPVAESRRDAWNFAFTSISDEEIKHTTGVLEKAINIDRQLQDEIARYEMLVNVDTANQLFADRTATGIQGNMVYKLFSRAVNYADYFRGVQLISSRGNVTAAQISLPLPSKDHLGTFDAIRVDNYVQVAGIKANLLEECPMDQVYICGHMERIQCTARFQRPSDKTDKHSVETVLCLSRRNGAKSYFNDIFVFSEGKLSMMIFGVHFTRVSKSSLQKILSSANKVSKTFTNEAFVANVPHSSIKFTAKQHLAASSDDLLTKLKRFEGSKASNTFDQVVNVISQTTDVSAELIKEGTLLEDLGIDSLMSIEVLNSLNKAFKTKVDLDEFSNLDRVGDLTKHFGSPETDALSLSTSTSITPLLSSADDSSSATSYSAETPTDCSGDGSQHELRKLMEVVSELVEQTNALTPDTRLEDIGFDSLLSVELAAMVKKSFNVNLNSHSLLDETFGGLCASVIRENATSSDQQRQVQNRLHIITFRPEFKDVGPNEKRRPGDRMLTTCFKEVDGVSLYADIYLPESGEVTGQKRPIALMIHGGGHVMLSRKDIRPRQTQLLLKNGFLPVSVDYRLCPEVNIKDGPMRDVCDALEWTRTILPRINLGVQGLQLDAEKVVVIGWSTGGTLALSLGFNASRRGIQPPTTTLAFYCPSSYEDDCTSSIKMHEPDTDVTVWRLPNYPEHSRDAFPSRYDLLEGVEDKPITKYNIDPQKGAIGGWCDMSDPRSRLILHMNCKGQALPILINGLPSKHRVNENEADHYLRLEQPPRDKIVEISPRSQIQRGNYHTPTYLIHSTTDDLIPLEQMQGTYEAMQKQGIECGLSVVEDVPHLFDLYRDPDGRCWKAVLDGYRFLCKHV